ncbi:MAG TPA: response regulator [Terriglobia bacterium]|nr:response regulator [Terriglobia bacterium]
MKKATILVVEDESIVAMDLQHRLISMGYSVPALAASGQDGLKKAAEVRPDLVLMDIRLRGGMDGIEVAEQIRDLLDVPPVYLTAYTDEDTLRRAKITEPFGYIVKPYDERTLRSTIEMALYRCKTERQLKQSEAWLEATLRCVSDAVIAADQNSEVVFMNWAAETLTGRKHEAALGLKLSEVVRFEGGGEQVRAEELIDAVRQNYGQVALANQTLVAAQGVGVPIEGKVAPILNKQGGIGGVIVAMRATNHSGSAR